MLAAIYRAGGLSFTGCYWFSSQTCALRAEETHEIRPYYSSPAYHPFCVFPRGPEMVALQYLLLLQTTPPFLFQPCALKGTLVVPFVYKGASSPRYLLPLREARPEFLLRILLSLTSRPQVVPCCPFALATTRIPVIPIYSSQLI